MKTIFILVLVVGSLFTACKKKDTCTTCTTYKAIYNSAHTGFYWQAESDTILCGYTQTETNAYIAGRKNSPDIDVTCK